MPHLAIIGAGIAGVAAAWALRGRDMHVTLFEKSRGVSGRAATRGRHGTRFDHGANYFRTDTPALARIVHEALPTDDLVAIDGDVWTFDAAGQLHPGDPERDRMEKWTYRHGISTLGKMLAAGADAVIHFRTRVHHVMQQGEAWMLFGTGGERLGTYDALLCTPPAPQAAALLEASQMDQALRDRLVGALQPASYRSQLSVILAYTASLPRPGDFYALVNPDGGHDVAWLGFEEDKPGHVPAEHSLLVVQMAPGWSTAHYEAAPDDYVPEVARQAAALLGADLPAPHWWDHQRWRYALPEAQADVTALADGQAAGLFFAGDAVAGRGRVQRAFESGLQAAGALLAHFGLPDRT